jgi:hypothetical protein
VAWLGLADLALQQGVWWAAVLLAARGRPLLGGAAGLLAVLAHVALRPAERGRVLRAALTAAAFGFATDSALSAAGLVTFAGGGAVSPPWMVGLWAAFGVGLTASARAVAAWPPPVLAAVGAVAGPLAYHAGAALGPLALSGLAAHAAVAVQWAAGLPLLAAAASVRRPEGPARAAAALPGAHQGTSP